MDIQWKNQQSVECHIHSTVGGVCRIRLDGMVDVLCADDPVTTQALDLPGIEFDTQAGKDYVVLSRSY